MYGVYIRFWPTLLKCRLPAVTPTCPPVVASTFKLWWLLLLSCSGFYFQTVVASTFKL